MGSVPEKKLQLKNKKTDNPSNLYDDITEMRKIIAVPSMSLFADYGVRTFGQSSSDFFVTPLIDLSSNWDFNKLFPSPLSKPAPMYIAIHVTIKSIQNN